MRKNVCSRILCGVLFIALPLQLSVAAPPLPTPTTAPQQKATIPARSDPYGEVVRQSIEALVKGDAAAFRKLLSPSLIKRTEAQLGTGSIDTIIKVKFIPFFKGYVSLNESGETLPTKDALGHKGLALFYSFLNTDDEQRPFAIYVLYEDGKWVVGNLLLNTLRIDVVGRKEAINPGATSIP